MPIITIKHEGKVYQRNIYKKQGFYCMYSKGVEYMFAKDIHRMNTYCGWHIVNDTNLPDFFMYLISIELEKLLKVK